MSTKSLVINASQAWEGDDGAWSSFTLGVGTPPQEVRLFISTAGHVLSIMLPRGCDNSNSSNCEATRGELFYKNASTTWEDVVIHALDLGSSLDGSGNGGLGFDTHSLIPTGSGALSMTSQVVASSVTEHFYRGTWGISPRPANLSNFKNPLESLLSKLKQDNFIPSLSYGYTAGAHYRLKQALGSLTLGGYDSSRFVPSNLSFDLAPEASRDLIVGIQSITADSAFGPTHSTRLLPSPILSFIDSTVPQIWLPLDACEAFEKAFGLRWDSNTELYLVNDTLHEALLAHNASITFQIEAVRTDSTNNQTVNITLPYASFDLEVSYPIVESSSSYFPIRRAANQSQYTLGRTFLQEAYLIVDYERSNFSVNPCIFLENAQQDISPIKSVETSNEKGTDTRNDSSLIFTRQSLSSPAVAWVTIAAVGLLILLACVTIILAIRRRRRRLRRYNEQAELPYPRHYKPAFALDAFQSIRREHELPANELGFSRKALQGTSYELGDIKGSKYKTKGIKHNPSSQKLRKNSDQDSATTSTCEEISKNISLATSASSLTSEDITGTANDSDHVVTSPHSTSFKTVELETDNMSSFDVLEAGHWTLETWPSIAENIRIRYREIMGVGNVGSINLLSCSSPGSTGLNLQYSPAPASPAVCISCKYPDRVNRSLLQEMLGNLKDLPIIVRSGSILRSGFEENCCSVGESCNVCQGKMLTSAFKLGPAAYGRYMQKPDCGASIGVNDPDLEHERVSLGGYILLNLGGRWILAAVTCHHLVDNSSVETLGIQSRVDGTGDSSISGVKYSIQSSAKIDHDGEVTRLRQRVENNGQSSQKVEVANIMDAYKSLLKAQLCFGEARRSSGISIDAVENLQMDWMLIEDIAPVRVGINFVGDTTSFMEGARLRVGSTRQVPTEYMSKDIFREFMRLRECSPNGQIGGLSRIHGRGCESGLGDGHLSRAASILCIGEMEATMEWSFKPRGTLGTSGDSGAWIFTELGTLLGQIFAHDTFTGMTYYTPAWALFNHIKQVTGATEIQLPHGSFRDSTDSGYVSILQSVARESFLNEGESEIIEIS